MNADEMVQLGRTLLRDAKAVTDGYTKIHDLTTIAISTPRMMESFTTDQHAKVWVQLIGFHILTKRARLRDFDSYVELRSRIPYVERFVDGVQG